MVHWVTGTFRTSWQGEERVQEGSCAWAHICWGRTVSASHHGQGHRTKLCGRAGLLLLVRGFWQESLSQLPQGSEGCRFHRQPQHPAAWTPPGPADGAEPLGWFGKAGGRSLVCHTERWARVPAATEPLSHPESAGGRGQAAQQGRHCPAPPACCRPPPAAKQDSDGKPRPTGNSVRHVGSLETTDELVTPAVETDAKLIGSYFGRKP